MIRSLLYYCLQPPWLSFSPICYYNILSRTIPYPNTLSQTIPYLNTLSRIIAYLNTLSRTIPYLNALTQTIPYPKTLTRTIPSRITLNRTILHLNTLPNPILKHYRRQPIKFESSANQNRGKLSARMEVPSRLESACYCLSEYMVTSTPLPSLICSLLYYYHLKVAAPNADWLSFFKSSKCGTLSTAFEKSV